MAAKYNVLFNGNVAFDEAKKQLDDTYEDNFWERLPIEPLKIEEEIIPLPGQAQTNQSELTGFEKAEEKAVKSIQKHSMVIDGFERNSQIDESYLLLGKSRYYLQRFIPALEAFSFGLENYPGANLYHETKIWKAKAHIRIKNEDLAIETLDLILKSVEVPDETFEKAHTAMAMAYTELDSTQQVVDHLKKATYYFNDRAQSARNLFILGQIYRERNEIDSSNAVFETLAYMKKIPRKYKVHAILERAKNYSDIDSTNVIILTLQDLIEDRDNRPYLDELYYQAGLIAQRRGKTNNAYAFYSNSVLYNKSKPYQKSLSYEKLGDLYFDNAFFELAGSYYDSLLRIPQNQNTKRIRKIIRKRESLEDVIHYENIVIRNDSILRISSLSKEDQELYFQKYIDSIKIKDEEEKKRIEQEILNAEFGDIQDTGSDNNKASGVFYFYNVQLVGEGKQKFKNLYGNRPLADNWNISSRSGPTITNINIEKDTVISLDDYRYDPDYYLSQIPSGEAEIDSIENQRNDAYYNLGLIYKEQFKEYELASENFEKYLKGKPPANFILPTKYQLYKTYANFNTELSNNYKADIVTNYPESRYAQIILNPENVTNSADDENSPENIYKNAYICFEEEDFDYALENVNKALDSFSGIEIEVKFELLKAYLYFKTKGEEAFIERLNYVIANYPNTEESKHALGVLEKIQSESKKNN